MSALSVNPPFPIFFDIDGQPLDAGYIYLGVANQDTEANPIQAYWDAALTVAATQPIRTRGGFPVNAGVPARVYVNSDFSIVVKNRNGFQVFSSPTCTDRFNDAVVQVDSSDVTFLQAGTGAVTRTAQAKMRDVVSVKDFGAVGDGVVDDTAAIQAAIDAMPNGSALSFVGNATYKVTAPIVVPPNLTGCVFLGNGATIRAYHNGDGLVMIATNQNFSRHKVYDLTIKGPNVSYPNNPGELAGTSTGAALKMGYDDTSNTVAGYLTSFYNCTFTNFNKGVYLQATILVNFYGGYISFNQYGVYVDGGQTNANTFYGVGIRENRVFGVYSSGRTGGSLSNATHNVFHSCEIETNIPYDASAGGYPATFNAALGHGIKLWNSYDWIFDSCYLENHNYSVLLDGSADDNRFKSCRFDGGGVGGVRPGSVVIGGANCNNNVFIDCKMVDYVGYAAGTLQILSSTSQYNQLIDCIGFSFNSANLLAWPHIENHRKAQGNAGNGQQFGALVVPPQGLINNPISGTDPGQINGIGTASATLNAFGVGEALLGNQITGATTITSISNMRPGQLLVVSNYQIAYPVTIQSSTDGTSGIVLVDRQNAVLSAYGDSITFYCIAIGRVIEVGRSLANSVLTVSWTPSFVRSGGSTPAQTSTGRYTKIGNRVDFWFECTFSSGPLTDSYYSTDFPFQHYDTSAIVGSAMDATSKALYAVEAVTVSRLRAHVTSSVTTFSGSGTLLIA